VEGSWVVTGAGRGIGAATALLAAEAGRHVVVDYVADRDAAERTAAACRDRGGGATVVRADVTVEADVAELFHVAEAMGGRVDVLVNKRGCARAADALRGDVAGPMAPDGRRQRDRGVPVRT
jgi:NAD(P)-dependent dehydrogenase (short-subunit alcohol dehydrogenase family)